MQECARIWALLKKVFVNITPKYQKRKRKKKDRKKNLDAGNLPEVETAPGRISGGAKGGHPFPSPSLALAPLSAEIRALEMREAPGGSWVSC